MNACEESHLHIPEDVQRLMEVRMTRRGEAQKAIQHGETTGEKFINPSIGRSLASCRSGTVTYWVEYSRTGEEYQVHSVYAHRMVIMTGGGMSDGAASVSGSGWICNRCQVPLEVQKVRLQYMQSVFPHRLPVCPSCNMVLVEEELATGKMAEAEQALEDK